MGGLESWFKTSRAIPLQIIGEMLFGTQGEYWEKKRRNDGVMG